MRLIPSEGNRERAHRARDLLQTTVLVLVALTPAWLLPAGVALPWLAAVSLLAAPALWFTWTGAPWVPTPTDDLDRVVTLLGVGPDDRVVDLGAGDGRVLRHVAAVTGARVAGVEAAPAPWLLGAVRGWLGGPRVPVRLASRYAPSARLRLAETDAVYLWSTARGVAHPGLPSLLARLPPGARVVCYATPLPFWVPEAIDTTGQRPIYRYVVGSSSDKQPTT